jgi:hypothetical protein
LNAFLFLKKTIYELLYTVGNSLLSIPNWLNSKFQTEIYRTKSHIARRYKILFEPRFSRALFSFFMVSAIAWLGLGSLGLIAQGLQIKENVVQKADLGNQFMQQAESSLASQNFDTAGNRFALASKAFSDGQQQLQSSGAILNQLLNLLPQKQDADRILQAANLVATSGQNFISLENSLKLLKISPSGVSASGQSAAEVLQNINDGISLTLGNLTQASTLVGEVNQQNLPGSVQQNFIDLKSKLQITQIALNNFYQLSLLVQNLLTGDKTILLLFENNNELRATGGFMGTFGSLTTHNGTISKINVSSIYDLDGQLNVAVQPPKPILNVSSSWSLRDSNWFADFPSTAEKITYFYEQEGGETPDLIVAMTPDLIVDLLKITGPITLPDYDVTLTSDNFVQQTQAITTISDNMPTNSPKQLLGDLVPILLEKIYQDDKTQWPLILQTLEDNLDQKQIVAYSRDQNAESELDQFHWSGRILDSDRDYLSVVSSNLGGTKTDLDIDQSVSLSTSIAQDGTITDELSITRTNNLPNLPDTENDSYVRIYTPLGSKLISDSGFDLKSLQYPDNINYTVDPDVYNWEKNIVTETLTGTDIGEESGKTFFGNWIDLPANQTKTVKLVYELPFKLSDIDRYSLLLQKQIGAESQQFNWTFNFPGRQIDWQNFDPDTLNTDNFNSAIILNKDNFFGLVLQKR